MKINSNDLFQNTVIFILVVTLFISVFNNRRLIKKQNEHYEHLQRIIITDKPRDYEKEIILKFDSIGVYVDTVSIDSTRNHNRRYLDEFANEGISIKR